MAKTMNVGSVAVLAAVGMLAACDPSPAVQCDDTTSQAQAMMTGTTTAQGQVSGYFEGEMHFEITSRQEHPDGSETLQTRHRFVTASGELRTEDTATLGPTSAQGTSTVDATLTIQPGTSTGRFAGASGQITAEGLVDYTTQPAPTLTGTYTGRICF